MNNVTLIKTTPQLARYRSLLGTQTLALVPTMGNLHAGHLSLLERAKQHADEVIVSIFVNPLQFGPHEDFDTYPRTLDQDIKACESIGINTVFAPLQDAFTPSIKAFPYPTKPQLFNELCGKTRPTFFEGITTIVNKLFEVVQPHIAVFGEKDYQQFIVIRHLIQHLKKPIKLVSAPIVRDSDGLALSSRNQYLSTKERAVAPLLYKTLKQIKYGMEIDAAREQLTEAGFKVDYLEIRRANDLTIPTPQDTHLICLVAAQLGNTRLIDNLLWGGATLQK